MEFTSIVEFPAKVEFPAEVEFVPSFRSGGRRGTDDTVIFPPGGRAFNPTVVNSRISKVSRTQSILTRKIIVILSLPPTRPAADHRLRSKVSFASGASKNWRIDADIKESI